LVVLPGLGFTCTVMMADTNVIWDTGLGLPIPLNTAFETNGARIFGTATKYFDFRGLELADGRQLALLGEALQTAG
jgi:putative ABC transport system permease protein